MSSQAVKKICSGYWTLIHYNPTVSYSTYTQLLLYHYLYLYPYRFYSALLYSPLLYSTLLYSPLLYSALLCSALLSSTLPLLFSALPSSLVYLYSTSMQVPTGHNDLWGSENVTSWSLRASEKVTSWSLKAHANWTQWSLGEWECDFLIS